LNNDGLFHGPCGLPAGQDPDPDYPNASGFIDDFGMDFIGRPPALRSPYIDKDFETYCSPSWISIYHYQKLLSGFQPYSSLSTTGGLLQTSLEHQPTLSVIATVHNPSLEVDFGTFYPLNSVVAPDSNRGIDYCWEMRDVNEDILDSRCFNLSFTNPSTGESTDKEIITMLLPYPEETFSVVMTHLGVELGRVSRSNNAPTIQLIYPNGGESWSATGSYTVTWTAHDEDNDPLHIIVSYSSDNGISWMPIALDITSNSLVVENQYLPGSTNARFKVIVSDQMYSAEDFSDESFTVGTKAPLTYIILPEKDTTVPPDIPIFLQGFADDLEDGKLVDSDLQWLSDQDGDLGTGETIIATLTPGQHLITLLATDSEGNISTNTITLYVGHKRYLPISRR
jgi:hypothetical protein